MIRTNPGSFVFKKGSKGVPNQYPCDGNILVDFFATEYFHHIDVDLVPPWTLFLKTKDPGFVRIMTSSDRTEIFIKKYLKTKKLQ